MTEMLCLLARGTRFSRSLFLILRGSGVFTRVFHARTPEEIEPCDAVFLDLDAFPPTVGLPRGVLRLGYSLAPERDLPFPVLARPFTDAELTAFLTESLVPTPLCPPDARGSVRVCGESVRLSATEAALYTLLYEADGKPVPRAEIAARIFPEAQEPDRCINVYIHYLREKLEKRNRRVIFSHRGGGYSLRRTEP